MEKKTVAIIVLTLTTIIFGYLYFSKPKPASIDISHNVIGSGTTTITTHSHAVITGATVATTLPSGAVVVSGSHLSVNSDVDTATKIVTEYVYKDKFVEKFVRAQWFVFASYGTDGVAGIGALKQVVGPIYAGIGIEAIMPPRFDLSTWKGKAYIGASF